MFHGQTTGGEVEVSLWRSDRVACSCTIASGKGYARQHTLNDDTSKNANSCLLARHAWASCDERFLSHKMALAM